MALQQLTPILWVTSLELTLQYYVDVLEFKVLKTDPTAGWAIVQRDEVELMFSLPNHHVPMMESRFTGSFYFRTNSAEPLWEALKDKASIVYPLEQFEYGMKEFCIRDCNGYLLQFGEEIQ